MTDNTSVFPVIVFSMTSLNDDVVLDGENLSSFNQVREFSSIFLSLRVFFPSSFFFFDIDWKLNTKMAQMF